MLFVEIDKSGIDECYQTGLVKPNEFRQICLNKIQDEVHLLLENMSIGQKWQMFKYWLKNEDWILCYYQELSDSKDGLFKCIIDIAASKPEILHINEEDAKLLFLSNIFHKKSTLVRDCSDLLNHELTTNKILIDKETLRAIDYLRKYVKGGKAVLKTLQEENNDNYYCDKD